MRTLELDDELAVLLEGEGPIDRAAREMIVLELYRRASISSGKAAELLGMDRFDFVRYADKLGIPYFRMTKEEWEAEKATVDAWPEP